MKSKMICVKYLSIFCTLVASVARAQAPLPTTVPEKRTYAFAHASGQAFGSGGTAIVSFASQDLSAARVEGIQPLMPAPTAATFVDNMLYTVNYNFLTEWDSSLAVRRSFIIPRNFLYSSLQAVHADPGDPTHSTLILVEFGGYSQTSPFRDIAFSYFSRQTGRPIGTPIIVNGGLAVGVNFTIANYLNTAVRLDSDGTHFALLANYMDAATMRGVVMREFTLNGGGGNFTDTNIRSNSLRPGYITGLDGVGVRGFLASLGDYGVSSPFYHVLFNPGATVLNHLGAIRYSSLTSSDHAVLNQFNWLVHSHINATRYSAVVNTQLYSTDLFSGAEIPSASSIECILVGSPSTACSGISARVMALGISVP